MNITHIQPVSLAKIMGGVGFVFGIVLGITYILLGVFNLSSDAAQVGALSLQNYSVILTPFVYGILFFALGLLFGMTFNIFAKLFGGVTIEMKD